MERNATLENREDVWRWTTASTTVLDAHVSADGTSAVKLLGNLGVSSMTRKIHEALLEEVVSTTTDTTATGLSWNTGAGALWTLYSVTGAFRSSLSTGITHDNVASDAFVTSSPRFEGVPDGDPDRRSKALDAPMSRTPRS